MGIQNIIASLDAFASLWLRTNAFHGVAWTFEKMLDISTAEAVLIEFIFKDQSHIYRSLRNAAWIHVLSVSVYVTCAPEHIIFSAII